METKDKDLHTIHESVEEIEEKDGVKQRVFYLVQKTPIHLSKRAWDQLNNFKKFGKALDEVESAKNLSKLVQGIEFDGGVTEDNVAKKLTKDKDLARLQKLEREKMQVGDGTSDLNKNKRSILDEFDSTTYGFMISDVALFETDLKSEEHKEAITEFTEYVRTIKDEAEKEATLFRLRYRLHFRKHNKRGHLTRTVNFNFDEKKHAEIMFKAINRKVFNNYVLIPEWMPPRKRNQLSNK